MIGNQELLIRSMHASICEAIMRYRCLHGENPEMIVINTPVHEVLKEDAKSWFPMDFRCKELTYEGIPLRVVESASGPLYQIRMCEPAAPFRLLREESVPEVRLCKDAIKVIHESIIPAETLQKIIDAFKEE